MEQTETNERFEGPMSDGEFIRKTDYKKFNQESNGLPSSFLIGEMLQQEYTRDFKLQPATVAMNNVPPHEFPFNRHTLTVGVGNVVVDFNTARKQHEELKTEQRRFAEEIEKVKEEMEKVRIIEKAWYDDYLSNRYINDLTAQLMDERSCGIGDACATAQEPLMEKIEIQKDKYGVIHVRGVNDPDSNSSLCTVKARRRYIVPNKESESMLPRVSL